MEITCVIPHRREVSLLWGAYASARLAGVDEFVIVANGRTYEHEHGRFESHFLWFNEGIGPARAREEGARHVTSEWIFFLDDDSIVPSGIFSDVPDADCVIYPSTTFGQETHYDYRQLPEGEKLLDFAANKYPKVNISYSCFAGPNGAMLVRKSAWEKVGGYGGLVDGYGPDEYLLGLRMKESGLRVMMDPRYIVWHYPSYAEWKNRDESMIQRFEKVEQLCR